MQQLSEGNIKLKPVKTTYRNKIKTNKKETKTQQKSTQQKQTRNTTIQSKRTTTKTRRIHKILVLYCFKLCGGVVL